MFSVSQFVLHNYESMTKFVRHAWELNVTNQVAYKENGDDGDDDIYDYAAA